MAYIKNRHFGYATPENMEWVMMCDHQQMSGYSVGIVYIEDVFYPMVPGNVVNAYTYDFPVRMRGVPDLDIDTLFRRDPVIGDKIIELANYMIEKEGIRALCSACGFFGNFHAQVADALDIPVALSSLVQIRWIRAVIKPGQKIGILTADKSSFTDVLLENVGVTDKSDLIIGDLRHGEHFSAILEYRGEFNNKCVKEEVVAAALELQKQEPNLGAILLECSDMPPSAYAVQHATQLPVWDFITLIKWLHNGTTQKPYTGWI